MNSLLPLCFLCMLCWLNVAAYTPGPAANEFAHSPITPGYGISNYFELMPHKVMNNNSIRLRSVEEALTIRIKSVRLTGGRLAIVLTSNTTPVFEKLDIALLSPNGCVVERFKRSMTLDNAVVLILRRSIFQGIYVVKIQGEHFSTSRKVMASR